jgi:poly(beta-D-mannuronate) C5 epimerase
MGKHTQSTSGTSRASSTGNPSGMGNPSSGAAGRRGRGGPAGRMGTAMLGTAVVAGGLLATVGTEAPSADAAACAGQVRYASSSNTLYLTSGEVDLPQLKQLCPAAPLEPVTGQPGAWFLKTNLVVQNGATLRIHGTAAGGIVNQLRLLSRSTGAPVDVVEITALHGNLDLRATALTSWDDATQAPDTDVSVPGGVEKAKGRAFVRAVSVMDGDTPRESRLDIADSDLGHLGYYAGEAYGVSYKARGCGGSESARKVCDVLDVSGSQRRSRFHHNMMGTYTWGAHDMVFDGNTYENNVMYGLDPHDDSDRLTITGNRARYNGRHGIICSQRCDGLTITGNEVNHNGIPPYTVNPADDDPQVHGIMLHRGVTDTVVAGNHVHDHPNGAGIAIFDSAGNVVRDNLVSRNKYGLRTSVGSHDLRFEDNTITDSGSYAVYAYPGVSDDATYSPDARPDANVFADNTIGTTGSYAVRLLSTDGFRFSGTTLGDGSGAVRVDDSTGFVWEGGALPGGGIVLRKGTTGGAEPTTGTVRTPVGPVRAVLDAGSELVVEAPDGRLSGIVPSADVTTHAVTPAGATLRLRDPAASLKRTLTPGPVTLVPAAGTVTARLTGWSGGTGRVLFAGATGGTELRFRFSGLTAGRRYAVRVDSAPATTLVAGAGGTIEYSYTEANGGSHDLSISALP